MNMGVNMNMGSIYVIQVCTQLSITGFLYNTLNTEYFMKVEIFAISRVQFVKKFPSNQNVYI